MDTRAGFGTKVMQGDKEIKSVHTVEISVRPDDIVFAVIKIPIESMVPNPDGNGFLIELVDDN